MNLSDIGLVGGVSAIAALAWRHLQAFGATVASWFLIRVTFTGSQAVHAYRVLTSRRLGSSTVAPTCFFLSVGRQVWVDTAMSSCFALWGRTPCSIVCTQSRDAPHSVTAVWLRGTGDVEKLVRAVDALGIGAARSGFLVKRLSKRTTFHDQGVGERTPPGYSTAPTPPAPESTGRVMFVSEHDVSRVYPRVEDLCISEEALQLHSFMRHWEASREWFMSRKLPWRAGALITSEPGCGKTTLALALAKSSDLPVWVVDLAGCDNDGLAWVWQAVSSKTPSIVLLDDLDRVYARPPADGCPPSMDQLLSCIDGASSVDGVFTIITANDASGLPEALLRPGRVDLRLHLQGLDAAGVRTIGQQILQRPLDEALVQSLCGATVAEVSKQVRAIAREEWLLAHEPALKGEAVEDE